MGCQRGRVATLSRAAQPRFLKGLVTQSRAGAQVASCGTLRHVGQPRTPRSLQTCVTPLMCARARRHTGCVKQAARANSGPRCEERQAAKGAAHRLCTRALHHTPSPLHGEPATLLPPTTPSRLAACAVPPWYSARPVSMAATVGGGPGCKGRHTRADWPPSVEARPAFNSHAAGKVAERGSTPPNKS